jgi:hypothetical protein
VSGESQVVQESLAVVPCESEGAHVRETQPRDSVAHDGGLEIGIHHLLLGPGNELLLGEAASEVRSELVRNYLPRDLHAGILHFPMTFIDGKLAMHFDEHPRFIVDFLPELQGGLA